jgi:hypothetical protein
MVTRSYQLPALGEELLEVLWRDLVCDRLADSLELGNVLGGIHRRNLFTNGRF